ncbi:MAG: TonB family protein [Steroidobacteraceae bacterium]|nr:TonB family protein [Steroidobacteraceae bacterium]MDW8258045.1 TonB family protein [Gammaproteobacteria bacterium]
MAPAAQGSQTELASGNGATVTGATYRYRVLQGEPAACKVDPNSTCRPIWVEIANGGDSELHCAGQIMFLLGAEKYEFLENFGTLVAPRATEKPFEVEIADPIDPARSFVVCATTAERDEADSGDAPFARRAPSSCQVKIESTPNLSDFYAAQARREEQQGRVAVRIALATKKGPPFVLGIAESSGFLRIDRGALLAASRMIFSTNCPGTQRVLPMRFELSD